MWQKSEEGGSVLHHRGQGQSFPVGSPTGPTLVYCLETQTKVPPSPD